MSRPVLFRVPVAALLFATLANADAQAQPAATQPPSASAPQITVEHAWARATVGTGRTGAAYMTLSASGAPDRLLTISTPVAATAELHETTNDNGVMKMRPAPGVAIAPGKPLNLAPGGYHVMLMGLKQPLAAGSSFPVTLTFEHAAPVTATVAVQSAAATPQTMPGHGKSGM